MAGSFRRRLLAIAALTVLACAAAIVAVLYLASITMDDRTEHARENVTREVERMRVELRETPRSARSREKHVSGELESRYVDAATDADAPFLRDAIEQATSAGDLRTMERTDSGGTPVLIAASPVVGGGYAVALQRVVAGRETRGLRAVVLVLALLSFSLVVASLRTLGAVERGVSSLRASLAALATNLRAPVARPQLRELDEVADGVASLATELVRAQEEHERLTQKLGERERLAALGRVAAGIAHEVRNPLASMKLRADLARAGGEATPAVAKDLEDIASEIARLDRLVSDLLVVAGRRVGPRVEVNVHELVAKRIALLAPWAATKKIAFVCDGSGRARVDQDAVARALDNLLRNAVEASPSGARVEATVLTHEDGARIVVTDVGAGVPEKRAAELFEPFFTTKPEGTGLGLALARAVASAHDGTLDYARDGDRTRFTLTLGAPPNVADVPPRKVG